jgi:hypothetical protein
MNHDALESTLKRLRPAAPSAELMARLRRAMQQPRVARVPAWMPRRPVLLAAAAVAAIIVFAASAIINRPRPVPASIASGSPQQATPKPMLEVFSPVEARNYLLEATPAALIHVPDQPPVRLVRCLWLDDVLCHSENGGAALEFIEAREQWVPVTAQVY